MEIRMVFMLAAGFGLFLCGMKIMSDAIGGAADERAKRLLRILAGNRLIGVLTGAVVTMIVQSSSASTVMVVGLVNSGLMNLSQAVGVIMGANIGTTITAQMIALNLTDIAPIAVFLGIGNILLTKKRCIKNMGGILTGFGILFVGIDMMSLAMLPLRTDPNIAHLMTEFSSPATGILAGVAVTVVLQSSSAAIAILQALAMQNLISIDGALFILFGQNVGTTVTALMASIGANTTARRAAFIHLLFNVLGTLFFVVLIQLGVPYADFVKRLSGADVRRQIANAHTGFNIINTVFMFPLSGTLVMLACKIIPEREHNSCGIRPRASDKRIQKNIPSQPHK